MTTNAHLRPVVLADRKPPTRPLEAIASDLGNLVANMAFAGLSSLERDWDAHCKLWGLCGR